MKKLTLAQAKKECGITPKDMKYWSYTDIVSTTSSNAQALFEQGYLTASVRDNLITYGITQANKGSY